MFIEMDIVEIPFSFYNSKYKLEAVSINEPKADT